VDNNNLNELSNTNASAAAVGGDQTLVNVASSRNYTGSSAVVVDPTLNVQGTGNLNGARVLIDGFVAAKDELGVSGQSGTSGTLTGGITWSYNDTTGVLSLDGDSTVANYQAALRSVTYTNATPNDRGADRKISFSLGKLLVNPENGHFYEFVSSDGVSWTAANTSASNTDNKYFGRQGYLTTITSSTEQSFVEKRVAGNGWIGASDAETEGTWKWVAGPENGTTFYTQGSSTTGYSNWDTASGEPNNLINANTGIGGEDYAHIVGNSGAGNVGKWNDLPNQQTYTGQNPDISAFKPNGYIVEYGGSTGDSTQKITGRTTIKFGTTTLNNPNTTPDFNNDRNSDLLWRNYGTSTTSADSGKNAVWVIEYNESAANDKKYTVNAQSKFITPSSDTGWKIEGLFDVNKDGITDIFWRNYGTGADKGKNGVWIMKDTDSGIDVGSSFFIDSATDTSWEIQGVSDVDGDGNANILWRNYGTGADKGKNAIWEVDYSTTTGFTLNTAETKFITTAADTNWKIEGWSDMNGDKTPDIVWRNSATGENGVWKLNKNTTTATTNAYFDPTTDGYFIDRVRDTDWEIEDVIDFDGDGIGDILWRNYGTGADKGRNAIWGMTSGGTVGTVGTGGDYDPAKTGYITEALDTDWEIEGVADYNKDGIPDIVWRNYGTGADKGKNAIWGMKKDSAGKVTLDDTKTSFITSAPDTKWEIEGPSPNNDGIA
jgi:Lectin C-type domain